MTEEYTLLSAFLVGLVGSTHCIGMCGGIVGILGTQTATKPIWSNLLYNLGRMSSYMIAGAIAGSIGYFALNFVAPEHINRVGQILSGTFMVLLGLYIAGLSAVLLPVEKAGSHLWKWLEPFGRRFLPVKSLFHAYMVGLVWGWLPCGMVYSILSWALVSANPVNGAGLMMAFALGTLPTLVVMGVFAHKLNAWAKQPVVRFVAGGLIVALGLVMLFGGGHAGMDHSQHGQSQDQDAMEHDGHTMHH
ncbi:MAG: sulfite exporter TauE/SafE family protein [Methylococcales bacterium]|jgi:uncharacterized protein|nr:sulfite exporter TauE/SafE family protein [Methylococcales bacterium]MBT7443160.1 sulfite exporter TauE/SafE family protein [Methylococcales bacterium]